MDFNAMLEKSGLGTTQPEDLKTFKMLLHGLSGTGKTSLAGTASKVEDLCPILFVDTEGGTMPLKT